MKTSDFFYNLPPELIAQTPLEPRDSSRLLCLGRTSGEIVHRHFYELDTLLNEGDLLVINDSRVIPARIFGKRSDTDYQIELLLLEQVSGDTFQTLVKPGKKAKAGTKLIFGDGLLEGEITEVLEDGNRIIKFNLKSGETIFPILEKIGQMPLPPYITEKLNDQERYQTIYAQNNGSSAAPTAGLHFTDELMQRLKAKGVKIASVTLHVGLGTFRPVKVDDVETHKMHSEHFSLSKETADLINQTKCSGGRVFAVGTTSCRTLESVAWKNDGEVVACSGDTDIFIYPSYQFKVIDGLITNFHLPESTLIMLVSAFCGYDNTMNAYKVAVDERYRFFSFGDAMIIS